jgi:hypothetical protein
VWSRGARWCGALCCALAGSGSFARGRSFFKDDVKEVREGYECGIVVDGFPDVQPGDILQAFDIETIAPTL